MNTPQQTALHKPNLFTFHRGDIHFFIDPNSPNWISTDTRGEKIIGLIDGSRHLDQIVRAYGEFFDVPQGVAWRDVASFTQHLRLRRIISDGPIQTAPYRGRSAYLKPNSLKELWVHLLQTCNLSCSHCLVSSSPKGEKGLSKEFLLNIINQAFDLGVRRFYFTGGEPFVRDDIFDLIRYVTEDKKAELIVMTNATLFQGRRAEQLKNLNRERLKFQVSLDGTTPETNDPIRGKGVFQRACEGLKLLAELGFETSLTAVVTKTNLIDLENLPVLAHKLGAKSVHLMWLHKRGRILETEGEASFPNNAELLQLAQKVKKSAMGLGVIFDNIESLKSRVNGPAGVKYDLGNLCWESLCLYMDGRLYPSAATAGVPTLTLGDARNELLSSLWLDSPVAQSFRSASLAQKPSLANNPFRFLTGGGDVEHSYFFSSNGSEGTVLAEDPYHNLYVELMKDIMTDLAQTKKREWNMRSGFTPPPVYHAMGDDAIACSEDAMALLTESGLPEVKLLHSNCVLSFDVEKPYRIVQAFYGNAAVTPQKDLCCPVKYDDADVSHIPQAVLDRFYGCGSPMAQARIVAGETVLDLGSGAGIDCFIAAKKVGPSGHVIGVDMTDEMLNVAQTCKKTVAENLGFDVTEFKKGYLEKIPADDKSIDLVTSNCVINLSPDKRKVFSEIWRVLKDTGRAVVADIVSDEPVPLSLQAHKDLWGECISGSLSEQEFMLGLERAGFYGLSLLKKTFWKEVEGHKFYSITVSGSKFEKKAGCSFIGQKAVYSGPGKALIDEEGHLFPRGEAVDICTDTAEKLTRVPYIGQFQVIDVQGTVASEPCCANDKETSCC